MQRRIVFAVVGGCAATMILLVALLFGSLRGGQIPEGLVVSGAVGLEINEASWRTTRGSYQAPLSYEQVTDMMRQQMSARGWRLLHTQPNLGPSIFNPDPDPLTFQRAYWFGWMSEFVRVTSTNGPPSRVEVVVSRTIHWPRFLRWLYARF